MRRHLGRLLEAGMRRYLARRGKVVIRRRGVDAFVLGESVRRVLEGTGATMVLDAGANEGQFHDFLRAEAGFAGPVISFEPVPELAAALAARAAAEPGWQVVATALGAHEGSLALNVMEGSVFSSFLAPDNSRLGAIRPLVESGNCLARVEEVPVARLDSFAQRLAEAGDASRLYLKMDTQGFDLEVFEGTAGLLDRIVAIQTELSMIPIYEGMPDAAEALARYRAAGFTPAAMVPVTRDGLRVIEFDCVLVRDAPPPGV